MNQKLDSSHCCKNTSKYLITYSCGFEPDQTLLVCESHYQEKPFQEHVKSLKVLECIE